MTQQNPRSLRHEYELYVENEIENYKESVSRSAILKIGDEAAASLRASEQFAMDELLLWAEVDRIIRKRLRIPAYSTWRRKRLKMLEEYRRPEHWESDPTASSPAKFIRRRNPKSSSPVATSIEPRFISRRTAVT